MHDFKLCIIAQTQQIRVVPADLAKNAVEPAFRRSLPINARHIPPRNFAARPSWVDFMNRILIPRKIRPSFPAEEGGWKHTCAHLFARDPVPWSRHVVKSLVLFSVLSSRWYKYFHTGGHTVPEFRPQRFISRWSGGVLFLPTSCAKPVLCCSIFRGILRVYLPTLESSARRACVCVTARGKCSGVRVGQPLIADLLLPEIV